VPLLHPPQRAVLVSSSLLCRHSKARHEQYQCNSFSLPLAVYLLLLLRLLMLYESLVRTRFSVVCFSVLIILWALLSWSSFSLFVFFFLPSSIHSPCCIMLSHFYLLRGPSFSFLCSTVMCSMSAFFFFHGPVRSNGADNVCIQTDIIVTVYYY
jgi:hypothetical protein